MEYRAKVAHAIPELYGRPANVRTIRADIDIVESDVDISEDKPPFYYQVGSVTKPSISCSNNLVTITASGVDSIYYTTDGTTPDMSKTKYTGPFAISQTVTVKAIAYYGELESSVVSASCTYVAPTEPDEPEPDTSDQEVVG